MTPLYIPRLSTAVAVGGDRLQSYSGPSSCFRGDQTIGGGARSICAARRLAARRPALRAPLGVWMFTTLRDARPAQISPSSLAYVTVSAYSAADW